MSYENGKLKQIVNQFVTLSYVDECIDIMTTYEKLAVDEEGDYILIGESAKEDYDIRIPKNKINNLIIRNDSIVIQLANGQELIIACENGMQDDSEDNPTE